MFPDPSTTRIVHDTMIAEEIARHEPDRQTPDEERTRSMSSIRRAAARGLVRLADRIAPATLPDPEPAGA